jgi:hypothetical protein
MSGISLSWELSSVSRDHKNELSGFPNLDGNVNFVNEKKIFVGIELWGPYTATTAESIKWRAEKAFCITISPFYSSFEAAKFVARPLRNRPLLSFSDEKSSKKGQF